jgi:hypothetical protein
MAPWEIDVASAPRQGRKVLAQIGRPEALRELAEQDEGVQERVHALIGKA